MDKRWIVILFIIIIASVCGYLIIQDSPYVGNAIADIDKSTVSIPYGFSVDQSKEKTLELINKNTYEKIYIEDISKQNIVEKSFEGNLKNIEKEYNLIDNFTNTTNNGINVHIAHYYDLNNEKLKNQSIAYFYTSGYTFYLKLTGFNNINEMNDIITFIVDTIKPDYKKPKDSEDTQDKSELSVNYTREVKSQD